MKSNFIYITTNTKQVIQLILIMLIVTDVCRLCDFHFRIFNKTYIDVNVQNQNFSIT